MEKKHYIIIIAVLAVLNIFSWRIWWDSPKHRKNMDGEQVEKGHQRRGNRGGMNFFAEKLNLSAEQKIEFSKLKEAYLLDVEEVKDSMNMVRKRLINTIVESKDDVVRDALFEDMAAYKLKMEQLTMQHFVNMRSKCNEEQKEKFDELITRIMDPLSKNKERGKSRNRFEENKSSGTPE